MDNERQLGATEYSLNEEELREQQRQYNAFLERMNEIHVQLHMDYQRSLDRLAIWNIVGAALLCLVIPAGVGFTLYCVYR